MQTMACINSLPQLDPFILVVELRRVTTSVRTAGKNPKKESFAFDLQKTLSPIVQCGLYGVEMLARGPCVNHAINLLLIGEIQWINSCCYILVYLLAQTMFCGYGGTTDKVQSRLKASTLSRTFRAS